MYMYVQLHVQPHSPTSAINFIINMPTDLNDSIYMSEH